MNNMGFNFIFDSKRIDFYIFTIMGSCVFEENLKRKQFAPSSVKNNS